MVSIIMATYNRAHFIEETLESIINQTYQDWECLIIDDGGNDNTEEVLQKWLRKDARFTYLKRTPNHQKGLPGCRNQGIELAKGDYIIFFDDDDIVHPQNLELCVNYLNDVSYDFCRYMRTTFSGEFHYDFDYNKNIETFEITSKDVYKLLTHELPFNSCAIMWRKSCFKNNIFQEELMYAEDWELYSRILMNPKTKGISIKKELFYGRKHFKSNTGEYFKGNSHRIKSKVSASVSVIQNLDSWKILDVKYVIFFLGIRPKSESKAILDALIESKTLTTKEKLYARIRFTFLPLLKNLYRFKKKYVK